MLAASLGKPMLSDNTAANGTGGQILGHLRCRPGSGSPGKGDGLFAMFTLNNTFHKPYLTITAFFKSNGTQFKFFKLIEFEFFIVILKIILLLGCTIFYLLAFTNIAHIRIPLNFR